MKASLLFILIGVIILLFSVGMALDIVPELTKSVRAIFVEVFGYFGGTVLTLYGIWKAVPDVVKSLFARVLRRIPSLPNYYKRRTVQFELESEINTALRDFSKEGAGFTEHEVGIKWLTPQEKARRLFFSGGKAYIKLDFAEDKEKNLVEAVLLYCNECLLPEARQYIARPLMRAIDITFVDELLDRRNAIRGRAYFTQDVIPREIEENPEIDKYLDACKSSA